MDINKIGDDIYTDLFDSYAILADDQLKKQLNDKLFAWRSSCKFQLIKDNPYNTDYDIFHKAEANTMYSSKNIKTFLKYIRSLVKKSGKPFASTYWEDELKKLETEKELHNEAYQEKIGRLQKILVKEWKKYIDTLIAEWEMDRINEIRKTFLHELREWLEFITQLKDTLDELSMETGFFWDMSKGQLSKSNVSALKKWIQYIKDNQSVQELCDLMGRIKRYEKSKRQEEVYFTTRIKEFIPDVNSKEEIIGLKLGRDLENVLPQEIALLSDESTSILFDIKYTENRLMCFEMQGLQPIEKENNEKKMIDIEEDKPGGPIIVCVDTSGSMQGTPENIAKALTLVLAMQAVSQKRDCLLINFSTTIESLELTKDYGIDKLFEFLQRSFYGGTDVAPAFSYALNMMENEKYERSDVLIISDFIMTGLSNAYTEKSMRMKENKNRFFSLCIGELFLDQRMHGIFDGEWVYNPKTTSIDMLKQVYDSIG